MSVVGADILRRRAWAGGTPLDASISGASGGSTSGNILAGWVPCRRQHVGDGEYSNGIANQTFAVHCC